MTIVFDPPLSNANKYCEILSSSFEKSGVEVLSIKEIFSNYKRFRKVNVVHLNWYENLNTSFDFVKKAVKLWLLILCGKKIVWTMHNKFPHEKQVLFFKNTLLKWLIKYSDKIIIHSRVSTEILVNFDPRLEIKIVYIPHPNYIEIYKGLALHKEHSPATPKLSMIFLGAIKPYKNIELLIEVIKSFDTDFVELVIAGKPLNDLYAQEIYNLSKESSNISTDLNFLQDIEMLNYICSSDILVLPYDMESSLNSGTLILAFSLKKTAICPEIGTVLELEQTNNILSYTYANYNDHFLKLRSKIALAISLKQNDINILNKMGQNLHDEIAANNSPEIVTKQFLDLYYSLNNG